MLDTCGTWDPERTRSCTLSSTLLTKKHPDEKVLVFTQFADTVDYLEQQLKARGVESLEGVTGDSADPTGIAWRFSPASNDKREHDRRRRTNCASSSPPTC